MTRSAQFPPRAHSGRATTLESHSRAAAWVPAALLLAALLAPAPTHSAPKPAAAAGPGRYTLGAGKVAVYNLAGTVVLEPTSGTETVVEVTPGGRDAARLKFATGEAEDRHNLRVLYPEDHIIYPLYGRGSSTSTNVRSDGTFGGKNSSWSSGRRVKISGSGGGLEAHADLRVLVPKGADVLVRLMVGDARVTNVDSKLFVDIASGSVVTSDTRGGLSIDTGSGDVRVARADGAVSIDTGSGSVSAHEVHGGDLVVDTGSGDVDASAIDAGSGGVKVTLPREIGAMLSLETGSGGLDVDLPLTSMHRDHGELRGQLGDGRGRIVIETGSGGIHIAGR
jgi:hypothetical protein